MRKLYLYSVFILIFIGITLTGLFAGGQKEDQDLVIYAYDSFVAEWGLGPKVIPLFEEKYGYKVELISAGDAGQVLSRAILEKGDPNGDIVVGIDNNLLARALDAGVLEPYVPENISAVPGHLVFDDTYHVIPFDYGYFAVIYDASTINNPPASLEELTNPEFEDSLILMDPRTSSPGLGFLLWTIDVYGEKFTDYWKRLEPSILTVTEGWDAGYGLFTGGEAPLVLSYTTSPAYHVEYEESHRYKAALFDEGHYIQIEGMGIVKNAPHREASEAFIDFMLTETFQSEVPLSNWMYPVLDGDKLPDSYSAAPKPEKTLMIDPQVIESNYDKWIDKWLEAVTGN